MLGENIRSGDKLHRITNKEKVKIATLRREPLTTLKKVHPLAINTMSEYESVSLRQGLRRQLAELSDEEGTYSDVVEALLLEHEVQNQSHGEIRTKVEENHRMLRSMAALQVRMALAQGIDKEKIPDKIAQYEIQEQPGGVFAPASWESAVTDTSQFNKIADNDGEDN